MANTVANTAARLYLFSGQVTSTLKTSLAYSSPVPYGISFDGINTPITTSTDILRLLSGQFTSTVKDSETVSAPYEVRGISHVETSYDTPWGSDEHFTPNSHIKLQSGQFTSTVKDSERIDSIDKWIFDVSTDSVNYAWIGNTDDKFYLHSGLVTSTLKTSQATAAVGSTGIGITGSWDTLAVLAKASHSYQYWLFLFSGQFTSTIKTSVYTSANDTVDATDRPGIILPASTSPSRSDPLGIALGAFRRMPIGAWS